MTKGLLLGLLPILAMNSEGKMLLKRELFGATATNTGSLTFASPSGFDQVLGEIKRVAIGASVNEGSRGWSGLVDKRDNRGGFTIEGTSAGQMGFACGWFRWNQFSVNSYDQKTTLTAKFASLATVGHGEAMGLYVDGFGTLYAGISYDTTRALAVLQCNTWYFVAWAWSFSSESPVTKELRVRLATVSQIQTGVFPEIMAASNVTAYSSAKRVEFGGAVSDVYWGGPVSWSGRMSAVSVYAITNFLEVEYPGEIRPPTASRVTWYVNPSSGDDSYDGLTPLTAWRSCAKLDEALRYGIVMGSETPWAYYPTGRPVESGLPDEVFNELVRSGALRANGDRVLVETTAQPLLTTNTIVIRENNRGVELCSATDQYAWINPLKPLNCFERHDLASYPNVWKTGPVDSRAVLWEDLKWMHSPLGTSIGMVASNLNALPGSFFNDGAYLYFHPFGSTDPNVDGKSYVCSQYLQPLHGAPAPGAVFYLVGSDVHLHHLKSGGVTFRNPTNGACDATYVLQNVSTGRVVVGFVDFFHGGNHVYGSVHHTLDGYSTLLHDFRCHQGPPWKPNATGFTTLVEHTTATVPGSRRAYFINGDWSVDSVVGSAEGQLTGGSWLSHGNSMDGDHYSAIIIKSCIGSIAFGETVVQDRKLLIEDGIHPYIALRRCFGVVQRCLVQDRITGDRGATVNDCVWRFEVSDLYQNLLLGGNWHIQNCVLDARNISNPQRRVRYPVIKGVSYSLHFENNVVLLPTDGTQTVAFSIPTDSTNSIDNNTYLLDSSNYVAVVDGNTDNWRAVAPWQALGYDVHSLFLGPAVIDFDTDLDGVSDVDELRAGTDPNDPASRLRLIALHGLSPGSIRLRWSSVPGRFYTLEKASVLGGTGLKFTPQRQFIHGVSRQTEQVETTETRNAIGLFRVRVE